MKRRKKKILRDLLCGTGRGKERKREKLCGHGFGRFDTFPSLFAAKAAVEEATTTPSGDILIAISVLLT